MYVTIRNISKSIRWKASEGATVLLGYLPLDSFKDVKSATERSRLHAESTHRAMEVLMEPLKEASKEGVDVWCADGCLCQVYPMVAAFVWDWPEQCDMASVGWGGCPVCKTPHPGWGDLQVRVPLRNWGETLAAIRKYFKYNNYLSALEELNVKPWVPWWADLPHTNFHACITPDLLHQLYQGPFKSHLMQWAQSMMGAANADAQFILMSRAEGMQHFVSRVSKIKCWTSQESREMMKQFLLVVVIAIESDTLEMMQAGLDFTYQAHSTRMTEKDLDELENSLATFHEHKGVVVETGVFEGMWRFNDFPKIHMLSHYALSI